MNKLVPVLILLTGAILFSGIRNHVRERRTGDLNRSYRIVFYNVENLFDIDDDSLTNDDEFTPGGGLHWTRTRYKNKLQSLSKVIVALGGWQPPDIIGLCEVENGSVLHDLCTNTPLSRFNYSIVHKDSDDARGIDVALLYNSETVRYIGSSFFSLTRQGILTRDILYFKALLKTDTCHFFVNHWPSRSAGQLESERLRVAAANLLRSLVDSVFNSGNLDSKVIIMGDFNDEPADISLSKMLRAHTVYEIAEPVELYNLASFPYKNETGTIKYQGQWSVFDQFIVSGNLLIQGKGNKTGPDQFRIFDEDFLLTGDEQYNGSMPYRTYYGYRYQGGFSDHLPVYLDLQ
ncbi:MAG: endonuclease [Bacteroidales bacterium]|nr:endonuclease [Bacteroidales bacterium]